MELPREELFQCISIIVLRLPRSIEQCHITLSRYVY